MDLHPATRRSKTGAAAEQVPTEALQEQVKVREVNGDAVREVRGDTAARPTNVAAPLRASAEEASCGGCCVDLLACLMAFVFVHREDLLGANCAAHSLTVVSVVADQSDSPSSKSIPGRSPSRRELGTGVMLPSRS